jgi:inositol-pentakisphosphate 2-kinase
MRDARASASTSAAVIRITADDVAHYAYAREGNAHVVFRYTGPRPELRGALLRLLKTPAGARGDRAWRCHTVDALVWGVDRDEASWTTLDAAARDAFFANAPTTSGRAGWRDDRAVVRVDGDALNALALKTTRDAAHETARAEGRDGRVANAAEAFGQLSEVAAETSRVFEDDVENAWVIEIKPKSFVGAIVNGRRAWRFPAHQRLKVARGEREAASSYVPVDLLGGDADVRRACEALMACPQNNLRVTRGARVFVDARGVTADADVVSTLSRVLPNLVMNAREVFEFIFHHQLRGGDDAVKTYRDVHELCERLNATRQRAGEVSEDLLERLRSFVLGQMAKDCSVLFTVTFDVNVSDIESRDDDLVRFATFVDANGATRACAYRAQIIDASLKSLAKTSAWLRLAEDIDASCVADADADDSRRDFVNALFAST